MSSAVSSVEEVFLVAQSLQPAQRLELISRLWDSIRIVDGFRPGDPDLTEIKRRWAEFEAGDMEARPWEEVRDSVRRRLGSHG